MIALLIYCALFALVIGGIDALYGKLYHTKQWGRTATHITTGLIVVSFPLFIDKIQIIALSAFFTLVLFISKIKGFLKLHEVPRKTWGEVYFPISIGFTAALTLPEYPNAFYAAVLSLALADAMANIIGTVFPIKRIFLAGHPKSVGGFLGCTVTVFVILISVYGFGELEVAHVVLISAFVGIAEMLLIYGFDNLLLPVMVALLCRFAELL